jgi:hypothetical protein
MHCEIEKLPKQTVNVSKKVTHGHFLPLATLMEGILVVSISRVPMKSSFQFFSWHFWHRQFEKHATLCANKIVILE